MDENNTYVTFIDDEEENNFLGSINFNLFMETALQNTKTASKSKSNVSDMSEEPPAAVTVPEHAEENVPENKPMDTVTENSRIENEKKEGNDPQRSRFTNMTAVEMTEFMERQENKNTKSKTTQDMNLLIRFLQSQGEKRPIESMAPQELSEYVTKFLLSVRTKIGEEYEPSSLRAFVASFDRHLRKSKYGISIANDPRFGSCMDALKAKTKHLKSIGKGNKPKAASSITDSEINTLFDTEKMGPNNPASLQNAMWFIFASQFGMRTGTEIHSLCWGDIALCRDNEGEEYIEYRQERQTKTRTGANPKDIRQVKPRAYETPETPSRCPVRLYQQYASCRPQPMLEEDSPFFLTVNTSFQKTNVWYKNRAMGINKIYSIMKDMTEETNIGESKRLTPYSVRKHMVQKLNDSGVPPNQIIQISGHKNVNSLNNYSALNEMQQKQISRTLSNASSTSGCPYNEPWPTNQYEPTMISNRRNQPMSANSCEHSGNASSTSVKPYNQPSPSNQYEETMISNQRNQPVSANSRAHSGNASSTSVNPYNQPSPSNQYEQTMISNRRNQPMSANSRDHSRNASSTSVNPYNQPSPSNQYEQTMISNQRNQPVSANSLNQSGMSRDISSLFQHNHISGNISVHFHSHTTSTRQSNTAINFSQQSNSPSPPAVASKRARCDSD